MLRGTTTAIHGKGLCWTARLIPMAIGAQMAVGVLLSYLDAIRPHDYEVQMRHPEAALIWFIPFLISALAWKWHLVGGLLIVMATAVFFSYFISRPPYEPFNFYFVYFPVAMVFLGGGVLHLAAWWKERRI